MKKFILPLLYLGLFFSTSTQNTTAQFREVQSLRNFDGSPLDLYGYNPYYNPIAESPRDFNFNLNFYDIYTLMNLEAAKRNANQTAINNWMRKQENVFKDEINRQLGTNHSNFNDAQRAYFKNFELQNRTLNTRISNLGSNYYTIANTINKTQETNTMQLFALDNFRNAALPDLKNIEINGKKISDMANSGNANYELSMARLTVQNQFAAKEYASAQNSALGVGIYLLHDDQTMINDFVNQHINFYKSKVDLRDKVSLMTLYLTDHLKGNLGPLAYNPYAITIPYFSQHDKLLAMGKAKTPNLNVEALVFAPNYIEDYNCYQRKPNPRGFNDTFTNAQCNARKIELYAIKDRVIEAHKNALYVPGISLALKLYGAEWATIQDASWLNMKAPFNASHLAMINKTTEYLKVNNDGQEYLNFAREAVKAYGNGGEADYENEIIKDKSFVGTKADCVFNELMKQTGEFKNIMDAFTNNNAKYKLKFVVEKITGQNSSAEAQTAAPDINGIIKITIQPSAASDNPLDITRNLLHEGIHAQLHWIIATGNKTSYNISAADYNWLIEELLPFWKKNSVAAFFKNNAQHDFMAVRYSTPIANAVRKFDSYTHPLENYMYFGWEGLFDEGKNRGLISMEEFNRYVELKKIPLNDNHKTICD
jgi:hypothetical protein